MDEPIVWVYISYLRQKLQAIQADISILGEKGGDFCLLQDQKGVAMFRRLRLQLYNDYFFSYPLYFDLYGGNHQHCEIFSDGVGNYQGPQHTHRE